MSAGGDVTHVAAEIDSGLVIERVSTREAADRWQRIAQECFEVDYYEMPADPPAEVYERMESNRNDDRYELWLGCLAAGGHGGSSGKPVVLGELRLPLLDNLDNAVVNVCTRPAFRLRGYGTAMLDHLAARARMHGRTRLIGEIAEPMSSERAGDPLDEPAGWRCVRDQHRRAAGDIGGAAATASQRARRRSAGATKARFARACSRLLIDPVAWPGTCRDP